MRTLRPAAFGAAVAVATLAWRSVPQHQPGGVELAAVRFYRGGERTLVDAFCEVPFSVVSPLPDGGGAYHITFKVLDSAGTVLTTQGWSEPVSAAVRGMAGGSVIEHFTFAAQPGAYRIEATVRDSASGNASSSTADVTAYPGRPEVSDILLTGALRAAAAGDTAPHPGEIKKGALFITATTRPVLTPKSATLYYYVEAYPAAGGDAETVAHVVGAGDHEVIATAPSSTTLPAGGGIIANGVDLTGLPPGSYQLKLDVTVGDTTVTRSAPFTMAGFATDSAVAATTAAPSADQFASATDAQLDSLYGPLVYIQKPDEKGIFDDLSRDAKIRYLRQFWTRRDPTPGTPGNEAEASYYKNVSEANRRYGEGGAGRVPGWRTDRGRIFLENGPPDDILSRPMAPETQPYEVWKYTRGRSRKYVFVDETGFGHYALVFTNDTHEVSRPNWQDILGQQAVQDVLNF